METVVLKSDRRIRETTDSESTDNEGLLHNITDYLLFDLSHYFPRSLQQNAEIVGLL
jgi:hypothetical protein